MLNMEIASKMIDFLKYVSDSVTVYHERGEKVYKSILEPNIGMQMSAGLRRPTFTPL